MGSGSSTINHLLFADDCFLFTCASIFDCDQITTILNAYEQAFGQTVNLIKSEVCFTRKVKRNDRYRCATVMGVRIVGRHERYLGLPTIVGSNRRGSNRRVCFSFIKERLWKCLQSWKGRLLSGPVKNYLSNMLLRRSQPIS